MATTFTFVTHKGPRPEHRGLVKSHVMRESQKKRKQAKQLQQRKRKLSSSHSNQAAEERFTISESSKQNSILSSTDVQVGGRTEEYSNIEDVETSSCSEWGSATVDSGIGSPCYTSKRKMNSYQSFYTRSKDSDLQHRQLKWLSKYLDNMYAQASNQDPTSKSQLLGFDHDKATSSPHYGIEFDIIDNPAHQVCSFYDEYLEDPSWVLNNVYERLNKGYAHYVSTFFTAHPEVALEDPYKFWESTHAIANSKALIGSVLLYRAYRAATKGPGDCEYDHDYFTSHILYIINRCVEQTDSDLSEEDIAIVISVCMYENVRGNPSIVTHLRGLQQLVQTRNMYTPVREDQRYLDNLSCLQDLVYATCSNAPPINFEVTGPALRAVQLNMCNLDDDYPQSPLRYLNGGQYEGSILELPYCTEVLKDAFDVFEMLCIEAFDADTAADAAYLFQVRQEQAWGRLQTTMEAEYITKSECAEGKMAEAILLAAVIHFRAVAFRIQHSDSVNTEDMKRLYSAMRAVRNDYWEEASYVYLWILLTCGAAAVYEPAYRSQLVEEILRFGICKGIFEWEPFRETMSNFLWLQKYLRGDCQSPSKF
ncbi:hypothetical protein DM02DRAFT_651241 [Periconia macrospinosa]|uniref:Uncharacterized protein n=1 Tax=Periconia macrospinosa TaxID=97972 RepID=A0A2V1E697_9PLEO|nr:hypothetical protein DM02DRAFT_651241 [Periconia macrospinosa]